MSLCLLLDYVGRLLCGLFPAPTPPAGLDDDTWHAVLDLLDAGGECASIATAFPNLSEAQVATCVREYERIRHWEELALSSPYIY